MPQILAAGTAAGTSSIITLAAGAEATLSLFVTSPAGAPTSIPALAQLIISKDDGTNAETPVDQLDGTKPTTILRGIGNFYVTRPDLTLLGITTPVGVWQD